MARDRSGFTLIELMIATVLIALLAAIALPRISATKQRAYDAAALSDLNQLVALSEAYFADRLEYPTSLDDLTDYSPSSGIEVTRFERETTDGVLVVHIHLSHQSSKYYFHVEYPVEPIEKRAKD